MEDMAGVGGESLACQWLLWYHPWLVGRWVGCMTFWLWKLPLPLKTRLWAELV